MKTLLLVLLFPISLFAQVCDSLVSPCVSTFSRNGYFFDLEALNTIQIRGFSFTVQNAGSRTIEVYYKSGTFVGSENNSSAWTFLGSMNNITPANAINCPLPHNQFLFASAITMNQGDRYGFYFQTVSGTGTIESHSNIVTGNIGAQDANLILYAGKGANPIAAAFTQTLTNNLTFQGAVIYACLTSTGDSFTPEYTLSPNPASTHIRVELPLQIDHYATITDVSGRLIRSLNLSGGGAVEIGITDLTAGIYFLTLTNSSGDRTVHRFVKQD